MPDTFDAVVDSVSAPARSAQPITPSDTTPLTQLPKALYIGTGGTLVMRGVGDASDQSWKNVPSGAILPFRAAYVRATGTTAADLLALL